MLFHRPIAALFILAIATLPGFAQTPDSQALASEHENFLLPSPEIEHQPAWLTSRAIGVRTWLSWGEAERHQRLDPANLTSDLKWRRMVSELIEISASGLWCDRLITSVDLGIGGVSNGQLEDQRFRINGQQPLFQNIHPASDDGVGYVSADLGWRFYEDAQFTFDGLIGYQFWREKYIAEGGARIVPPGPAFPPGPVITEQFTWHGLRIGFQSMYQLFPRWSLKTRVLAMPLTHLEVRDIHHLRPDFLQDPSSIDRAIGGVGVLGDIRFTYWICKGLYAEIGYRIWHASSGEGETTLRFRNAPESQLIFNEGSTTRQGLVIGLTYQF